MFRWCRELDTLVLCVSEGADVGESVSKVTGSGV